MIITSPYTGRFAPSPSGLLHFGSLVAALGSYLQCRSHHGRWLVRIEDLDPPREVAGAAHHILYQLEHYGLHWDGEVLWQSQRHAAYQEALAWLQAHQQSYYCTCPRRRLQTTGGYYDGHCREQLTDPGNAALRLYQHHPVYDFTDGVRGQIHVDARLAQEDFVIRRRDGLFAYNLAVVVDDHFQGVTEVVRGADLIEPTVRQIALYQQFGWPVPRWFHLPLALTRSGRKLSKQNHAPELPQDDPRPVLVEALCFLGQTVCEGWLDLSVETLLNNAIERWTPNKVPPRDLLVR